MRNNSTKRAPHVIWVCPDSRAFYRAKGEVRCRPGSVIPKLSEHGLDIDVLIPYDANLLPKTKLSPPRITRHTIHLQKNYPVDIVKLTRGSVSPGIFMAKTPALEPAFRHAVFAKAALALAHQLKRPVDIFHLFEWESALLPLFLEMEKDRTAIFRETRTFFNVRSLKEQGNFPPSVMDALGLPGGLFQPGGIEFFGKVSFLKSGLLFSDGVGLVDGPRPAPGKNGTGLDGVLDTMTFKLRRWASERSLRSHLDAYEELLATPRARPLLPTLLEKLQATPPEQTVHFVDSWGPQPPDRYGTDSISFIVQAPLKAYAFWEWHDDHREFGILLEMLGEGRRLLGRGLGSLGEFWLDTEADRDYAVELIGWTPSGQMETLLRSHVVRTPRNAMSPNTNATFVDVSTLRRFLVHGSNAWADAGSRLKQGATSALEWTITGLPSSLAVLPGSHEFISSSFAAVPSSGSFKKSSS